MKQYLKNSLILGVILLLSAYLLDYGFTSVFKSGKTVKVQWLQNINKTEYDYAIIGSSRAWWNINSNTINTEKELKGINLSNNHFGLSEILLRLKRFYENKNSVDTLLLQIDYKSVFSEPGEFSSTVYNYLPFLDDSLTYNHLSERSNEWRVYKHIPFWRYAEYNFQWGIEELLITKLNLRQTLFDSTGNFFTDNKFHGHPQHKITNTSHNLNTDLLGIVSFCEKHNIELICFTAPYYQLDISDTLHNRFNTLIDSIDLNYKNYALIYNTDSTYFNDNTHLSLKGGQAFTQTILDNHF